MPDSSSSSSTASSTGTPAQTRSTFNQAQLEDLELAESIVTESRRDAYKTALAARDAMVREINDRRMEIQFAADGLWPYTDPASATARASFHLPRSRPFSG